MQNSPAKPREGARTPVSMVARYRRPTTFEYVEEACTDVSIGGMFIRSTAPAAAGTLLKLECATELGGAKIQGVARVVWLRTKDGEDGPSGMGVKFVKLDGGSRAAIDALVKRTSDPDPAPAQEGAASERTLHGEVLTMAIVPQTMSLADAAASAEPLPETMHSSPEGWKVWAWTLGGLAVFMAILSSEQFRAAAAGRPAAVVISETAAAEAAALHRERSRASDFALREEPLPVLPSLAPNLPTALPEAPPAAPAAVVAVVPPAVDPVLPPAADTLPPSAATKHKPGPAAPRRAPTQAAATAAAAAAPAPAGNPLEAATACLQRGDNACVIAALSGRAKSAQEHELLIETLRSVGKSAEAQKYMTAYVARFPNERRASAYKRLLETQRTTAPAQPTIAPSAEAPPSVAAPEPAPAPAAAAAPATPAAEQEAAP